MDLRIQIGAGGYRYGCERWPDCHQWCRGDTADGPTQWQRCEDHWLPMTTLIDSEVAR